MATNESVSSRQADNDWIEILEQLKTTQRSTSLGEDFLDIVKPYFSFFHDALSIYANEMSLNKDRSIMTPDDMKELVLQTRAALRYGLYCLSTAKELISDQQLVCKIQTLAVVEYCWYEPLVALLSYRRGDFKCRIMASRLLSNIVTSNREAAAVVATMVPLSPSTKVVSTNILNSVIKDEDNDDDKIGIITEPNWVDMILSSAISNNRESIAAIAAALHNCIVSLCFEQEEVIEREHEETKIETKYKYAKKVASNGLLISTFLRHFVAAKDIVSYLKQNQDQTFDNHWDSATEWIQILLSKLSNLGMLEYMYSSIGNTSSIERQRETTILPMLPEQNILSHCMAREAAAFVLEYASNKTIIDPFGGEAGSTAVHETYKFLSRVMAELSPCLEISYVGEQDVDQEVFDTAVTLSGLGTVIDILASTLGIDSPTNKSLRSYLGHETTIIEVSAQSLGVVTDALAQKSIGKRARDIHLSSDEQKIITSLVQLIGNLCYECKDNQDLLRTTNVPISNNYIGTSTDVEGAGKEFYGSLRGIETRNGLHVLLTCTSYATSCFTLREWGVIAIRNALEDNTENQAVVAALIAQDTVQTADLEQAGVRVQLDSKGKVTLSKIDEEDDANKVEIVEEDEDQNKS